MNIVFHVPPLQPKDVRELSNFLDRSDDPSEKAFHLLLEQHPALLGVLGYIQFLSEHPIPKRDSTGETSEYTDRLDILGARPSEFSFETLYVDIIELKAVGRRLSQVYNSQRFSSIASSALTQLFSYERELTNNQSIKTELGNFGFKIASPMKILIFGRDSEFSGRPYDYEMISAQFREQGVFHYTVDHMLRIAEKVLEQNIGRVFMSSLPPEHVELLMAGDRNWKISIEEREIIAQAFDPADKKVDLLAWRRRNPGMIYVPKGYLYQANQGYVMCCPDCGSENIVSHAPYKTPSGQVIGGDEADPYIVCEDCGATDIHVSFKKA